MRANPPFSNHKRLGGRYRALLKAPTVAALLLPLVAACSGSDTAPTPGPEGTSVSEAALRVTIDSLGSEVAIASHSDVRFEASVAGASVRDVRIEFGDGTSAREATARHVYTSAGTYTARATFTTATGEQLIASQSVVVNSVEGLWSYAAFNESTRGVEVRRLTLTQAGQQILGTYSTSDGPDRPVTGTLSSERDIRLSAGGESFDGVVPSPVKGPGILWLLRSAGGASTDRTLAFRFAFGEPSAPPVASLALKRPEGFIVEGLDIGFDASGSSGDDLMYFVEFGDGRYTTEPVSEHALEVEGHRSARLTVVDRFGRVAVVTPRVEVDSVTVCYPNCYITWRHASINPATGQHEFRILFFERHEGRYVEGTYGHPDGRKSPFAGYLSGSRDIRITLDGGGIEFSGTIRGTNNNAIQAEEMALKLRGGSADGQQLSFQRWTP